MMLMTRAEKLEAAKAALIANRDVAKLMVCPGPRGADTKRYGVRRLGRHLHWYIGEFQRRPGVSGPVQCDEVPQFRTETEAKQFLDQVRQAANALSCGATSATPVSTQASQQ